MVKYNLYYLGDRLTVGRRTLAPSIGVRIPVPQQGTILRLASPGAKAEFDEGRWRMLPPHIIHEILLCLHSQKSFS